MIILCSYNFVQSLPKKKNGWLKYKVNGLNLGFKNYIRVKMSLVDVINYAATPRPYDSITTITSIFIGVYIMKWLKRNKTSCMFDNWNI